MGVQRRKTIRTLSKRLAIVLASAVLAAAAVWAAVRSNHLVSAASEENQADYQSNPDALLSAYRRVEVASVSDAAEQLLGKRLYPTHRMQPLFATRFAGFALTVRLEKREIMTRTPSMACWQPSITVRRTQST